MYERGRNPDTHLEKQGRIAVFVRNEKRLAVRRLTGGGGSESTALLRRTNRIRCDALW